MKEETKIYIAIGVAFVLILIGFLVYYFSTQPKQVVIQQAPVSAGPVYSDGNSAGAVIGSLGGLDGVGSLATSIGGLFK
jgi:hypothetical protein